MPKLASSRVAWSGTHQQYRVEETGAQVPLQIAPERPAWFGWLDQISSFAVWGKSPIAPHARSRDRAVRATDMPIAVSERN
jgi:hypothetical protein